MFALPVCPHVQATLQLQHKLKILSWGGTRMTSRATSSIFTKALFFSSTIFGAALPVDSKQAKTQAALDRLKSVAAKACKVVCNTSTGLVAKIKTAILPKQASITSSQAVAAPIQPEEPKAGRQTDAQVATAPEAAAERKPELKPELKPAVAKQLSAETLKGIKPQPTAHAKVAEWLPTVLADDAEPVAEQQDSTSAEPNLRRAQVKLETTRLAKPKTVEIQKAAAVAPTAETHSMAVAPPSSAVKLEHASFCSNFGALVRLRTRIQLTIAGKTLKSALSERIAAAFAKINAITTSGNFENTDITLASELEAILDELKSA
jgi:hypothetical protein